MKLILCLLTSIVLSQISYAQDGGQHVYVLGIAQDGGFPHAGCQKKCCASAWQHDSLRRLVVSLALVDSSSKKWWLFEATPDIKFQLQNFRDLTKGFCKYMPDGIFITHAHIGHYTGLMELGREVMSTKAIPVYVLPRMKAYLETNGPWSQLVKLNNIVIQQLTEDSILELSGEISVQAFSVPHRDEYSETAGFKISTTHKKYLFIPDIDKWQKWDRNIVDEVKTADVALLDGTFYAGDELPGRNMNEVPHPFVIETMELFKSEVPSVKSRIFFIHLNHTNELLWNEETKLKLIKSGFSLAEQERSY